MSVAKFLNPEEESQILEAIRIAETNTSGEIRVHLETECKTEVLERAQLVFKKLNMHNFQYLFFSKYYWK